MALPARAQTQGSADQLRSEFANLPADARPMMRWWWFGPAVGKPELARELDAMHAAGIGGVELAAVYPLALDDPAKNLVNARYASPEYVDAVQFAADHARSLGMRVDLTLGSGWPFGGPEISMELAAGRLKAVTLALTANVLMPKLEAGEHPIAAFLATALEAGGIDAGSARQIPWPSSADALPPIDRRPQKLLLFIAGHTRQQVKRAAFGGEGFVLDHMAKPAIEKHLEVVGNALLKGFPKQPPYAIFSDSLEVYGSDWTPELPAEFQRRRGYDLIPHLPELLQGGTPQAEAVRHDWGVTLAELVRDNYLQPMTQYARAHGTRFRSQTYGEPAATLADEHIPQLPEGEGPQWRAFSFTRWASSANHVYGNPVTSAETWTWLHSPAFRATPLDMKAEADRMFLQGVNQIVGHGFPYSAPGVPEPGWSLYAAAALNDHNPWWPVMPDVMRYLTRVSWALRQGAPANDVAILLPEADAQAAFRPGHVSVTEEMKTHISPQLMGAILDAGYNVDYIDLPAIADRGLQYPVVVVPPTTRMPLSGVHALAAYAKSGGKIVFLGTTPHEAPGLNDAGDADAVQSGVKTLVRSGQHINDEGGLPAALNKALAPDVVLADGAGKLGFLHRRLASGDLYFLANTSPQPLSWNVSVRLPGRHLEWWDPETGRVERAWRGETVTFDPYGSRLLFAANAADDAAPPAKVLSPGGHPPLQLTAWTMSFPGSALSSPQPSEAHPVSTLWSEASPTRFYSGEVRYSTSFEVSALRPGEHLLLRFAPGQALPDTQPPSKPGMRAWFEPPVREAAEAFLNGKRVGALWHPPYSLDVSDEVHAGKNMLDLRVYNTAINSLAGQPPRDYTALKARFGDRFQMQDMDHLQPASSGIAGPVTLEFRTERDAPVLTPDTPIR